MEFSAWVPTRNECDNTNSNAEAFPIRIPITAVIERLMPETREWSLSEHREEEEGILLVKEQHQPLPKAASAIPTRTTPSCWPEAHTVPCEPKIISARSTKVSPKRQPEIHLHAICKPACPHACLNT